MLAVMTRPGEFSGADDDVVVSGMRETLSSHPWRFQEPAARFSTMVVAAFVAPYLLEATRGSCCRRPGCRTYGWR